MSDEQKTLTEFFAELDQEYADTLDEYPLGKASLRQRVRMRVFDARCWLRDFIDPESGRLV